MKGYESLGKIPVSEVIEAMREGRITMEAFGKTVKLSSIRMLTFLSGVTCVYCKISGDFFSVERQVRNFSNEGYHLNLYHEKQNGELEMMTSDHIIPKSINKDLAKVLSNRQCLCSTCNNRKGNSMEGDGPAIKPEHFLVSVSKYQKLMIKAQKKLSENTLRPDYRVRLEGHLKTYTEKFLNELDYLKTVPSAEQVLQHFEL